MLTAIIDADILAYRAASVSEKATDWGDGLWTLHAFEQEAALAFDTSLQRILEKTQADSYLLALSDSQNWRKDVLPTYKGNRADTRKPILLNWVREYIRRYECVSAPTLEGDDVIGIVSTTKSLLNPDRQCIICTTDKDLKTIPGKHYNFGKDEFFEITPHQADYWHMMQTLTGDATDGYTGVPGCGPKTAEKIMQRALEEGTPWANPQELREIYWKHVLAAYGKAGLGEEEALVQARVARILHESDYDQISKKVILWNPPNSPSFQNSQ
jgi:5'-3' exonuclease